MSFALKFVFCLLNYLRNWFLSILYSPILKSFLSIAIGYRLIELIICDYILLTLQTLSSKFEFSFVAPIHFL